MIQGSRAALTPPPAHARAMPGHGGPAPAPGGVAQTTVRGHDQPGQSGVGQQRDRCPAGEADDVGVDGEDQPGDEVRRPALLAVEHVHHAHRPPGGDREQRAHPQALRHPHRQAQRLGPGEPRSHGEQVADELAALDVAQVRGGAPQRRHPVQEEGRVDGELDARVDHELPGPLDQREDERTHAEDQRNRRGTGHPAAHGGRGRGCDASGPEPPCADPTCRRLTLTAAG